MTTTLSSRIKYIFLFFLSTYFCTIIIGCGVQWETTYSGPEFGKLFKKDPADYIDRGMKYNTETQYKKAIEQFTKAISLNPKSDFLACAYAGRASSYSALGEYKLAVEDCNSVLKIKPNDAWLYVIRGTIYRATGRPDKACNDFSKACDLGECEAFKKAQNAHYCK